MQARQVVDMLDGMKPTIIFTFYITITFSHPDVVYNFKGRQKYVLTWCHSILD